MVTLKALIALVFLSHFLHLSLSKHFTDRVGHHLLHIRLTRVLLRRHLTLELLFHFWIGASSLLLLLRLVLLWWSTLCWTWLGMRWLSSSILRRSILHWHLNVLRKLLTYHLRRISHVQLMSSLVDHSSVISLVRDCLPKDIFHLLLKLIFLLRVLALCFYFIELLIFSVHNLLELWDFLLCC